MISGARQAEPTWFRKMVARAISRRLKAFTVPGPDVARAHGLAIEDAGLQIVDTPRHAGVLLLVGELPEGLREAAAVAYAQMMRPRAVFAVGTGEVSPLPEPDVSVDLEQGSLASGVEELRRRFAEGAFASGAENFEAEVVEEDEEHEGGMDHGHDHGHGSDEEEDAESEEEDGAVQEDQEMGSDEDQSQPEDESGEKEIGEDQLEDFMSMIEMTEGMPASGDGLIMEWVPAPYGPLFPGLPGGLSLTFTLDGDTVVEAEVEPGIQGHSPEKILHGPVESIAERAAGLDPLTPAAHRLLACRAIENAVDKEIGDEEALSRIGALERGRAASHLGWMASFGYLIGDVWISQRAARLQLALLRASDIREVGRLKSEIENFIRKALRTPLLGKKLGGIGALNGNAEGASGPTARAAGVEFDARPEDPTYRDLGFSPIFKDGNDALTRFQLRLEEIRQSLDLVLRAGTMRGVSLQVHNASSGTGTATIETPRGTATLRITLESGSVADVELDTPSTRNVRLVEAVTVGKEVADALVGVGSLDLSPWEMSR